MPLGIFFWVIFILWVCFGTYRYRADYYSLGGHGLLAVLIFLLGWSEYGFIVSGK
jgi:hypothetical protein